MGGARNEASIQIGSISQRSRTMNYDLGFRCRVKDANKMPQTRCCFDEVALYRSGNTCIQCDYEKAECHNKKTDMIWPVCPVWFLIETCTVYRLLVHGHVQHRMAIC